MSHDYIKIMTASGMMEAEILRGYLRASGIDVLLRHESAGTALGLGAGPLGEVDLLVAPEQEQRAHELLDDYYAGRTDEDDEQIES